MKQEKAIEHALRGIRDLVHRMRAEQAKPRDATPFQPEVVFIDMKLGGLGLSEELADKYRECLARLEAIHGKNPTTSLLSAGEAKSFLHRTVLRITRPKKPTTSGAAFARRVARELAALRKRLIEPPREWIVSVPARGFFIEKLPRTFGGVRFDVGSAQKAAEIAARIRDYPRPRKSKDFVERERAATEIMRTKLREVFAGHAIATTTVRAHDGKAAHILGLERIRRTIDVINFFAPYLIDERGMPTRAFLISDGARTAVPYVAAAVDGKNTHSNEWVEPRERRVALISPRSPRATRIGFRRAHELLEREALSDVEQRVVNALAWAGRASVAVHRDEEFLLFTIALEALFTQPDGRGSVTDRIRQRTVHLVGGGKPSDRVKFSNEMKRLYSLRSEIVHGSDAPILLDKDMREIRHIVSQAIWTMLKMKPFCVMKRAEELEAWFEERILR